MPHVILTPEVEPEEYFHEFEPWKESDPDGTILEVRSAYLRRDKQVVLLQAVSLELGPGQHFFVAVEKKKQQVTVRCHPHPRPVRTEGVKRIIARIARDLVERGAQVEKTNLEL